MTKLSGHLIEKSKSEILFSIIFSPVQSSNVMSPRASIDTILFIFIIFVWWIFLIVTLRFYILNIEFPNSRLFEHFKKCLVFVLNQYLSLVLEGFSNSRQGVLTNQSTFHEEIHYGIRRDEEDALSKALKCGDFIVAEQSLSPIIGVFF